MDFLTAFNKILSEGRKPRRLRSDAATDFISKEFQRNLKQKGVTHFTTHSEKQANYVERFIKTIEGRIWHHIRASNSRRYTDVLLELVSSYNKSWHTGIQSEPINVNKENENKLWWQMYWPKYFQFPKITHKEKNKLFQKLKWIYMELLLIYHQKRKLMLWRNKTK